MSKLNYSYWEYTEPPWDHGEFPWLVRVIVRWAITIAGFLVAEWFVNEVLYDRDRFVIADTEALLLAAAIYVVLRGILRPLLLVLTCPLQILTLGLFIFVVNALIVLLVEQICDLFDIAFVIDGFWPAFVGALIISLVSFVISRLLRRNPFLPRLG
ncbi:MAG TPA: phage holin family protein [Dehalococcoidia bacterium]|nr:phage holin family protein [Dehalococcoidia bacterium]